MDTFEMIADERRRLADLLDGLSDEQWETPSLCDGWTVRAAAAHLVVPLTTSIPRFGLEVVKNGFSFDKANKRMALAAAERPTSEIVATLRAKADHRFKPPGLPPEAPLADVIVHGQDICRPLGIKRDLDPDRLLQLLAFVTSPKARGFVPKHRLAGLRLTASDVDWSHGDGAEVNGPAEALLMVVTGRPAALDDLAGDGVGILRERLEAERR